ncbi:MAG: cupin domain-containing protein [Solirubrobacteraceae bacterium]|jgi:mannose-6-phosphate isomerase-like protein (cupin superfamily)
MESDRALVVRQDEARAFMEGDEFCRHYVTTDKITFGTSTLQPGQRGGLDTGHAGAHEAWFCISGNVLIDHGNGQFVQLRPGDLAVMPEGLPHTLVNVGEKVAYLSWSLAPSA